MYYFFCIDNANKVDDIKPRDAASALRFLGARGNLFGFDYAIYMIGQVMDDPELLTLITKRLYPETGKYFGVTSCSVERNLRTLVHYCWKNSSPEAWQEISGRKMLTYPTNGQFLDMIVAYLKNNSSDIDT